MRIKELMTQDVQTTTPQATIKEAAELMQQFNIGFLPVCEGSKIVGVMTDRDIILRVVARGRDPSNTKVRDIMTIDIVRCFDDQEITEIAKLMEEKQVRRLPVLNRDIHLIGVISLGDLAIRNEELAGEILREVCEPVEVS